SFSRCLLLCHFVSWRRGRLRGLALRRSEAGFHCEGDNLWLQVSNRLSFGFHLCGYSYRLDVQVAEQAVGKLKTLAKLRHGILVRRFTLDYYFSVLVLNAR